ncbi:MAG: hypothetical protein P8Y93_04970, partial [Acidobacteriota bacterium]
MNRCSISFGSAQASGHPRGWLLLLVWIVTLCLPAAAQERETSAVTGPKALDRVEAAFTGDLPEITGRGLLRILISYSRTNYFIDFATARGFEYELLRQYEKHLNQERKVSRRIVFVFIPVPLESLLSELAKGRGDIAAGGLTVTQG